MQKYLLAAMIVAATGSVAAQSSRDHISIVGSSTVYPFSTLVAEHFGKTSNFKTPKIESTGTGGGFKLFCAGVGPEHADIANASRPIKDSEVKDCKEKGAEFTEFKIGYDGIVMASSKTAAPMSLTTEQIYLALAKKVPSKDGKSLVDNPYKKWSDIDKSLPDSKIEVLGPPPTSGTRDAFAEMALDNGCKNFEVIKALSKEEKTAACQGVREDGAYIEAGENDNLIVNKLTANPAAVGIFGYSFLEENTDKVQAVTIAGKQPNFDNIASGEYPLSRPLFIYVKNMHIGVIPGIKEFVQTFLSEEASGQDGYLKNNGLIPLSGDELAKAKAQADSL
ncbi:PstS family phosphate ABC transporter substrate-binding protein [Dichelobacter nodosus]|uniref:Phosphate binding family protein n=1 Tax=Dichelobacter nodosus (strain VCS1703A) TaxID=246195 RepID=A5EXG3_DICNV|nr:PstS family phosphate ABC transporter substrate-binding protein [Dichelobacter nodosus]ABQ14308.1 phosphate binding family protein [Dichelobacter nodosus VCS1703A]AXM45952.1 PstS family phosphate ABC transporter substrate-binding protein [Dichelobacter nodosus]TGA64595.1 PstS family phosphate ABC transporter substrate-binding protein [Dichelobacter nodosus]